ncbi:1-(5-phosphoribosyl)-5-((5-phosphoribosylamino)methylideneamino)imidazole-4-carboxamide isomerase [Sulfurisphaera ohwakuensis]|uniref:1-(5-phosphoribosyl)-5-[(5-phosphoribosylamino)methylideneamino] imidazole-4-carboxamide isomerase n=1 Tax=Sulfurisphaera ohwakuensis TaxID=69656 RepID=A0A650CH84_SULOH|nr:1-(5-phosphoribosyl)-5-((5-phosphoribosylamino)methylideneamino)imidazole-4-carboxamide isomerase [Sulfurisphaera ohwakuensis]MBB5252369.1 phosphoribosylformimino-5-aminoimidazole carboxamide ribotide isomerase [Sulfurisphaera ohwakuensis]QGR17172.1 1-(5-phosphoribosyl)-5-((5-phosphoribosylamino)methylideneamino)imidazole-4-carboxamide isomerase [Sulfurisphaera ohwakuensis]
MLKVVPSIDISEGKAVKRIRGVKGSGLILGNPVKIAYKIYEEGYDYLHVVDLDSAEENGNNEEYVKDICKIGFKWVQVGGGIRNVEKAERLLDYDCSAIVISTLPIKDPKSFMDIQKIIGKDKILLSVDYDSSGYVLIRGWKEKSIKVLDFLLSYDSLGYIFTYVENEGTKRGIDNNVKNYVIRIKGLKEYAGGIGSIEDLYKLNEYGINYAIIGMSFYSGSLRGIKYVY